MAELGSRLAQGARSHQPVRLLAQVQAQRVCEGCGDCGQASNCLGGSDGAAFQSLREAVSTRLDEMHSLITAIDRLIALQVEAMNLYSVASFMPFCAASWTLGS